MCMRIICWRVFLIIHWFLSYRLWTYDRGALDLEKGQWRAFDGNLPHATLCFRGTRYTLIFFTIKQHGNILPFHRERLLDAGFPLPSKKNACKSQLSKTRSKAVQSVAGRDLLSHYYPPPALGQGGGTGPGGRYPTRLLSRGHGAFQGWLRNKNRPSLISTTAIATGTEASSASPGADSSPSELPPPHIPMGCHALRGHQSLVCGTDCAVLFRQATSMPRRPVSPVPPISVGDAVVDGAGNRVSDVALATSFPTSSTTASFLPGSRVEARHKRGDQWYKGTIATNRAWGVDIQYDDGDRERGVPLAFVRRLEEQATSSSSLSSSSSSCSLSSSQMSLEPSGGSDGNLWTCPLLVKDIEVTEVAIGKEQGVFEPRFDGIGGHVTNVDADLRRISKRFPIKTRLFDARRHDPVRTIVGYCLDTSVQENRPSDDSEVDPDDESEMAEIDCDDMAAGPLWMVRTRSLKYELEKKKRTQVMTPSSLSSPTVDDDFPLLLDADDEVPSLPSQISTPTISSLAPPPSDSTNVDYKASTIEDRQNLLNLVSEYKSRAERGRKALTAQRRLASREKHHEAQRLLLVNRFLLSRRHDEASLSSSSSRSTERAAVFFDFDEDELRVVQGLRFNAGLAGSGWSLVTKKILTASDWPCKKCSVDFAASSSSSASFSKEKEEEEEEEEEDIEFYLADTEDQVFDLDAMVYAAGCIDWKKQLLDPKAKALSAAGAPSGGATKAGKQKKMVHLPSSSSCDGRALAERWVSCVSRARARGRDFVRDAILKRFPIFEEGECGTVLYDSRRGECRYAFKVEFVEEDVNDTEDEEPELNDWGGELKKQRGCFKLYTQLLSKPLPRGRNSTQGGSIVAYPVHTIDDRDDLQKMVDAASPSGAGAMAIMKSPSSSSSASSSMSSSRCFSSSQNAAETPVPSRRKSWLVEENPSSASRGMSGAKRQKIQGASRVQDTLGLLAALALQGQSSEDERGSAEAGNEVGEPVGRKRPREQSSDLTFPKLGPLVPKDWPEATTDEILIKIPMQCLGEIFNDPDYVPFVRHMRRHGKRSVLEAMDVAVASDKWVDEHDEELEVALGKSRMKRLLSLADEPPARVFHFASTRIASTVGGVSRQVRPANSQRRDREGGPPIRPSDKNSASSLTLSRFLSNLKLEPSDKTAFRCASGLSLPAMSGKSGVVRGLQAAVVAHLMPPEEYLSLAR